MLNSGKRLLAVPKNGQFKKKITKKFFTHFLPGDDFFSSMADIYVWKSKRVKNMQDYTQNLELGDFYQLMRKCT